MLCRFYSVYIFYGFDRPVVCELQVFHTPKREHSSALAAAELPIYNDRGAHAQMGRWGRLVVHSRLNMAVAVSRYWGSGEVMVWYCGWVYCMPIVRGAYLLPVKNEPTHGKRQSGETVTPT